MNEIDRFIAFLQYERRFSTHTVKAYSNDLLQFTNYLKEQYQSDDPVSVSHIIIRSWIVSLMEKGLDARSVGRKITTLRTFFRFLVKEGKLERTPMLKVQAPKMAKKLPEYIDEQKMNVLLTRKEGIEQSFEEYRNFLLVDFFYRTGVRLAELIQLKMEDVNLYNLTVNVLGKRNKVRQIPLTMNFKTELEEYFRMRKIFMGEKGTQHSFVFIDNSGNQMYPKLVYRIVKASISEVSTGKKKSPHILRHSFATAMLNHGADINAIKELLGHSSLAATQVYTHNSIEKLKEIYKQAFPKA